MNATCHNCKKSVSGVRIADYSKPKSPDQVHPEKISFYRCPSCGLPIVLEQALIFFPHTDQGEWATTAQLYPVSDYLVNPAIPAVLQAALSEAIQTHEAGVHTAAAIMCRRTLDGFCAENGATKKNLAANLKELRDNGTINDQLYEWADALRLSGNEAAHDVQVTFSAEDAQDLLDFTMAILDFTYSFRVKFEAFRMRRGSNNEKTTEL
jgi:hypothetical protein